MWARRHKQNVQKSQDYDRHNAELSQNKIMTFHNDYSTAD